MGIICPDVNDGRMIPPYDDTASGYSKNSTVQINFCVQIAPTVVVCAEMEAIILNSAWGYSGFPHQNSALLCHTSQAAGFHGALG